MVKAKSFFKHALVCKLSWASMFLSGGCRVLPDDQALRTRLLFINMRITLIEIYSNVEAKVTIERLIACYRSPLLCFRYVMSMSAAGV